MISRDQLRLLSDELFDFSEIVANYKNKNFVDYVKKFIKPRLSNEMDFHEEIVGNRAKIAYLSMTPNEMTDADKRALSQSIKVLNNDIKFFKNNVESKDKSINELCDKLTEELGDLEFTLKKEMKK